jgi:DNA-binding transcriptional ArsR family regulator
VGSDSDSNTDEDAEIDSDTDEDAEIDSESIENAEIDSDSDSDTDEDAEIDSDTDEDAEIDSDTDENSETDSDSDTDTNATAESTTPEEDTEGAVGFGGQPEERAPLAGPGAGSGGSGGLPVGSRAAAGVGAAAAGVLARRLLSAGTTGGGEVVVETARQGRLSGRTVGRVYRSVERFVDQARGALTQRFWRVLAAAGYLKRVSQEPLSHDTRAALYEHLQSEPGTYLSAFAGRPGIDASQASVRYHLSILEREGLVTSEKRGGRRRYYPLGMAPDALSITLESDTRGAILNSMAGANVELTVSELAERVDRDPSTVTYHLGRLEEDGLVDRRRDGEAVRNSLPPGVAAMLRDEPAAAQEPAET